jgi:phenylpyruvate tautomerase PptA (4-oxalocrotonate tautomerase family)
LGVPVVEIELVSDEGPPAGLAQVLADSVGAALRALEGTTWVRLRVTPRAHYAESGGPIPEGVKPVFVTITERVRPTGRAQQEAVEAVTAAVAEATGNPKENVHVLYADDVAGRIAFGGRIVE